jgi:hypothetical protein
MQGTVALILATAALGQYNPAAAKLHENREVFKRQMMPDVGKVVTVTGKLSLGKISHFVWMDDPGAVYIRATKPEEFKKEREIVRQMDGKRVTVTGKLQFAEVVPKIPTDRCASAWRVMVASTSTSPTRRSVLSPAAVISLTC